MQKQMVFLFFFSDADVTKRCYQDRGCGHTSDCSSYMQEDIDFKAKHFKDVRDECVTQESVDQTLIRQDDTMPNGPPRSDVDLAASRCRCVFLFLIKKEQVF